MDGNEKVTVVVTQEKLDFEWDEDKNQINIKKHGIDFMKAIAVFYDPFRLEIYDIEHSIDEDRYCTIGRSGEVLFVVYTERKDKIRLISARLAEQEEIDDYYRNCN